MHYGRQMTYVHVSPDLIGVGGRWHPAMGRHGAIAYRPYQLAENVPYIPVGPWFKASSVRLENAHLNQSQEKELVENVFYWCPPKDSKHK